MLSPTGVDEWRGSRRFEAAGGSRVGYPAAEEGGRREEASRKASQPPGAAPARPNPEGAAPAGESRTRNAVSQRRGVHRQPRPTHAGPTGRPPPAPEGRRRRERGG